MLLVETSLNSKGYLVVCDSQIYIFLNSELSESEKKVVYESLILQAKEYLSDLE